MQMRRFESPRPPWRYFLSKPQLHRRHCAVTTKCVLFLQSSAETKWRRGNKIFWVQGVHLHPVYSFTLYRKPANLVSKSHFTHKKCWQDNVLENITNKVSNKKLERFKPVLVLPTTNWTFKPAGPHAKRGGGGDNFGKVSRPICKGATNFLFFSA